MNAFKVQPGMVVTDVGTGRIGCSAPSGPVPVLQVDIVTAAPNIHVTCTSGTFTGSISSPENIRFSGCGYPGDLADHESPAVAPQAWRGNCAATAYLFYGLDAGKPAAGSACDYIHSHEWRVYFHMHNGGQTSCNKMIFDSGSSSGVDDNDTADPTSIGIWADGEAAGKTALSGGKTETRTGFLNSSTDEDQGVTLSDFNIKTSSDYSLVFANSGLSLLTAVHGGGDGVGYADSSEAGLTLTGNVLGDTTLAYNDPAALPNVHCANNTFATSFCANLLTHTAAGGLVPSMVAGTVSGNDGAGRIVAPNVGPVPLVTLIFGTPWASTPVCFAQDETSLQKNPIAASNTSSNRVTFKPTALGATFNVNDIISYQCTGFK